MGPAEKTAQQSPATEVVRRSPVPAGVTSPGMSALRQLQRYAGNRAAEQILTGDGATVAVSHPGEREADEVADRVMRKRDDDPAAHTEPIAQGAVPSPAEDAAYPSERLTIDRPFSSAALGAFGTPDETTFRRAVYDEQLARTIKREGRPPSYKELPAGDRGPMFGGFELHRSVAEQGKNLMKAAKAALAADKKAEIPEIAGAHRTVSIGVASAYRSPRRDLVAWKRAFETHFESTRAEREKLATGPFGSEAIDMVVKELLTSKAIPGFSKHSASYAIDFETEIVNDKGKVIKLSTHMMQNKAWQETWLWKWLDKHGV